MAQIDTRFPAWMAQKNWATSNSVSHDLQTGYQLGQRNKEFEALQEFRASQLRSQDAYRQTQINTQLMRQHQFEAEQTDAALVTEWMKDPRQPPPTGLRTPKGLQAVAQVQKVFAASETGNHFTAVQKGYTDKIKELPAVATLQVQQLLDASDGRITPEIAALIDAETAKLKATTADLQVLDEMGQPFVKGGDNKPAFIRSGTGALHRVPQDWDGQAEPLTDIEGNVIGYGIRTGSGNIRVLPTQKPTEQTLTAPQKAAMNSEFKTINQWWADLDSTKRAKPENQAELQRRLKAVQDKYSVSPATPVTPAGDASDPLGLFK